MNLMRQHPDKVARRALEHRQAILREGLSRRDLLKMGLLSSSGFLVLQSGLSARAKGSGGGVLSPRLTPFVEPLTIMPVLPERTLGELGPTPNISPNRAVNPATGLPFEGRTEAHQSRSAYPVRKYLATRMGANTNVRPHPDLPPQTFWGYNKGGTDFATDPAVSPGPTIVARYGSPVLVRRFNDLPPPGQNGGFGVPEVDTHLHNFHSATDSDGGPCNPVEQRFFFRGQYYDYFYNMQYAGFASTHRPAGDIREALGTLWYHDHRVDHTAENVYKGLAGMFVAFNEFDTGDETTGLRLPGFPDFDIPIMLSDKLFDPTTGLLYFDTFGLDGLVGDTFLVNGTVQPFLEVTKRRYRLRICDGGPSRFYQLFLTNPDNLGQSIPVWVISSDGNLLPRPVQATSFRLGVAERNDVIVDFAKIAERFGNPSRIWLENRLEQVNGRGPTGKILPPGQGNALIEFRLVGSKVVDTSFDPEPVSFPNVPAAPDDHVFGPIGLPPIDNETPRLTRSFRFERGNGQWQINGQFMACTDFRFTVQQNTMERWILKNNSGSWQHPVHIHLEEFRILRHNGQPVLPGSVEYGRKDTVKLGAGDEVELVMRFRDYKGAYPMHCHNTVHEDHAMMLLWNVDEVGDNKNEP
ncbi:MAG: bilirubin oxidase [Actinobacteria bacterium]|nr:MAG: bilirubin oxidase [Actinomycetota bacterium]